MYSEETAPVDPLLANLIKVYLAYLPVPDEVRNISLVFDKTSAIHNTSTQTLTVSVTVSWLAPLQTRGILQPYSVTIWNLQGMVAFQNLSVSPDATSLSLTVSQVSPATDYFVNITATTSGGNVTATSPASISPEAGEIFPRGSGVWLCFEVDIFVCNSATCVLFCFCVWPDN